MSERLTSKWTDTSESAFGPKGKKGDEGEVALFKQLTKLGLNLKHNPSDVELQNKGWDYTLYDEEIEYGIDVKTNLFGDRIVFVDKEKIWKSKAEMWFHYDDSNGRWIRYFVEDMRRWLTETNQKAIITNGGLCYEVPQKIEVINGSAS